MTAIPRNIPLIGPDGYISAPWYIYLNSLQTHDAALDALSAVTGTGLIAQTAADTFATRTITAGTGISISNGNGVAGNPQITCTVTSPTNAYAQSTPADPTATASGTVVMMGLAGSFTPSNSGKVLFVVSGNTTAASSGTLEIRYGTGTAPTNGTAVTGTKAGATAALVTASVGFCVNCVVTGLTPSTSYWFDLGAAKTGGASNFGPANISMSALES